MQVRERERERELASSISLQNIQQSIQSAGSTIIIQTESKE